MEGGGWGELEEILEMRKVKVMGGVADLETDGRKREKVLQCKGIENIFIEDSALVKPVMFLCFRSMCEDEAACKQVRFKSLSQGCPKYSTKGCMAAGFCSNQATAHQTELI